MVNRLKVLIFVPVVSMVIALCHSPSSYALSKSVEIKVSATVAPVFEISVEGPTGGNIEFGTIHRDPHQAVTAPSKEVIIKARSNLGQPYEISQKLVRPLVNENGKGFGEGAITAHAVNNHTDGTAYESVSVSTNPTVLFRSNPKGLSDTVTAVYNLKVQPDQDAGHYTTGLVYTITAL